MPKPSKHILILTLLLFLLLFGASLTLGGCTKKSSPENAATQEIHLGRSVYQFDYEQVTELVIAKNDPTTGDHWTVRVTRPSGKIQEGFNHWKIASAPESTHLVDTTADGNFILHLLDTLRTIQPTAQADEGPLSSFGLEHPLFSLKWSTPDATSELFIGDSNLKNAGAYALFGSAKSPVYIVQGAALAMLTHLDTFSAMRKRRLFTFETDDIDEIQIRGESLLLRAGDRFVDHAKHPLPKSFSDDLEQLTHAQILNFIDDDVLSEKLGKWLEASTLNQATFSDRQGNKTILKVAQKDGKTYGSLSSRPGAVFELYSKVPDFFTRANSPKSKTH